ncbi:hypothetical protein ACWN8V_06950 [Vagococcus elongatus]|uniref:Uncharacterized protein n=1 Tax=Vagococcus elongatus TaxID=180344 RepID=A0A430AW30_9ENTE|nr:hypothetical protein [Vagococcus elongatus]RSU12272.1 hypothetical protein CBF29_06640 [Vagococcus elongatus]
MFEFTQLLLLILSLFFFYMSVEGFDFQSAPFFIGVAIFVFFIYRFVKNSKIQKETKILRNQLVAKINPNDKFILNVGSETPIIAINADEKVVTLLNENNEVKSFKFEEVNKYEITVDDSSIVQKDLAGALFTPAASNVRTFSVKRLHSAKVTIYLNNFDHPFESCIIWGGAKVKEGSSIYKEIDNEIKKTTAYFDIIGSVVNNS